jgi:hypothetical protein
MGWLDACCRIKEISLEINKDDGGGRWLRRMLRRMVEEDVEDDG